MRCPVGQLCNPAQVPPAFLKSLCCTCTAPVETSVPVQRYLNSPSSGEGHEQSKCFFLQPHSFSGLWVNFRMSKNGGWWGQFISLLRNIIWQWNSWPKSTVSSWLFCLFFVVHLFIFFLWCNLLSYKDVCDTSNVSAWHRGGHWGMWRGRWRWKGVTPHAPDVRSLCPLLSASVKSFFRLSPTIASLSVQEIPVLTAKSQNIFYPACLVTHSTTWFLKERNKLFCTERISFSAAVTATHKTQFCSTISPKFGAGN